jgi:PTH1 family peptidyl-tRNA hydrolase
VEDSTDLPIIVVGLGNPGFEYDDTRHNVGFMVVDALSAKFNCLWYPGRGEFLVAQTRIGEKNVVLVKPLTYMNNSGRAVRDILEQYNVPLSQLLVVLDDFWFDVGMIRLRSKGSDGGHNGLSSIIYHLHSEDFARLRCGIRNEGMPAKSELATYVLSPFEDDEKEKVEAMIATAAEAVIEFALYGIEQTMNKVNTRTR